MIDTSTRKTIPPGTTYAILNREAPEPAPAPPLPEWVAVADHVFDRVIDRIPTIASRVKITGASAHIVALWIVVASVAIALVSHLVGDGTVRSTAKRSECLVEWLVERAVAEDRGDPPPQLSPLACAP